MDQEDKELIAAVNQSYSHANRYLHYGMDIHPQVTWASAASGRFIAEWLVTDEHIGASGCVDEGCLATVTDNTTAMLIASIYGHKSVSTSITVQAVAPVQAGTVIEISCSISDLNARQPHAKAVFRVKDNPTKVIAVGTHTKFFKPILTESQPHL
ncbi:hypothetical protein COEREDRAFT_91945 [Coemansia reversa NRRL 1564]|uniref:Thioesterase domain-containing protein n=1 Tax=Coemansia reversa (strain ATCC 12441 / NRRL 1564) TaxID=763665 RepID=A0A2G5BDZ0_COERN|nr:hypothetical protein COEREDRAFT_91945 [Coemansia reversa NRRL 1564]|eukprot:PIA17223.1 hypothetical protein COEREDRAFT_91945 [Coemansia reversa NRRL 1564]